MEQITGLVSELLADEVPAAEISFVLASIAIDLGLQSAPTAEHAFGVVLSAMMAVLQEQCSQEGNLNSDIDSSAVEQPADPTITDIPNSLPTSKLLH